MYGRKLISHVSTVVCLTVLTAALPAQDGVVFDLEVKEHTGKAVATHNVSILAADGNLKTAMSGSGMGQRGDMVFVGKRREMIMVDHDSRSYFVIDPESMAAMNSKINSAMTQLNEAMKNMSPKQREMFEKMMKGRMPETKAKPERPKSVLKKRGEKKTVNGYPCVKYEILRDGRKIQELWVTDWSNIEGGPETAETFVAMADFMQEMLAALTSGGGPLASMVDDIADESMAHMKEMKGLPIYGKSFAEDGSVESETTLRSARKQQVSPTEFDPPKGYKKREMMSP